MVVDQSVGACAIKRSECRAEPAIRRIRRYRKVRDWRGGFGGLDEMLDGGGVGVVGEVGVGFGLNTTCSTGLD